MTTEPVSGPPASRVLSWLVACVLIGWLVVYNLLRIGGDSPDQAALPSLGIGAVCGLAVFGAGMLILTTAERARERGWGTIGRLRGWATVGVEPSRMGIGPAPAIRRVLDRLGMTLADLDLLEINEAFAGQILAVVRELDLDTDKLNVNGGAIALGHPLAASGARLTMTLLKELGRRGGGLGVASACIGGGQGIALVVESEGKAA